MSWRVISSRFVQKVGTFTEYDKPMREPRRYPKLLVVVLAEFNTNPLAQGCLTSANVNRIIPDCTQHYAHQLAMCKRRQLLV